MTAAQEPHPQASASPGSLGRAALLLAPVVTGLAASAALAVDYIRPSPVFCDPDSGCAALKQLTRVAFFAGVPTPVWGLVGFLTIGAFAVQRGSFARNAGLAFASVAALVAVGLLGLQAFLQTWCPFCVVTDTSACIVFGLSLWRKLGGWDPPAARLPRAGLALCMAPAIVAPIAIGALRKPVVPEAILREIAQTPKGEVTLVDFADFECPFCRMTHASIAPVLAEHQGKVRVVRKHVPLTRLHPHALDAARAACCGDKLGKGDAMADALFSAPVDDLTPEGCAKLAVSLGLDEDAFRKCTVDPSTDERIKSDQATFKAAHGHGLPLLWIDEEKIEGYRQDGSIEKTIEEAIAKSG
jgi:predicted DsbA family dithiol-disulfide isomerase/uncharacterized membrane protein